MPEDTVRRRPGSESAGDEKEEASTTAEKVRGRYGDEGAEDGCMRDAGGIDEEEQQQEEQ